MDLGDHDLNLGDHDLRGHEPSGDEIAETGFEPT